MPHTFANTFFASAMLWHIGREPKGTCRDSFKSATELGFRLAIFVLSLLVCGKLDGFLNVSWYVALIPAYGFLFLVLICTFASVFYMLLNFCNLE